MMVRIKKSAEKLRIKWFIVFSALTACVDKIYFNVPPAEAFTVVEGMISDAPGPYTVKISKSLSIVADSSFRDPIEKAKIKLYDDEGNTEDLVEASPGVYVTGGVIQGKVGHGYSIIIETEDGRIIRSDPDTINPVGEIDQIKYQYVAKTFHENYGDVDANVFNIYVDGNTGPGANNYVRWRFTGTYQVDTHPELHRTFSEGYWYATPFPCSGYTVLPALGGGNLTKISDCTCCTCWITQFESVPNISDGQFINNNEYKNVMVAEVPINGLTFSDKYMVEVEQMSLTENAFQFFKMIRAQKESASSLFQPPSGKVIGNLSAVNSTQQVVGLFWATSVKSKYIFIPQSEVPYIIQPVGKDEPCTTYSNSSLNKPDFWQ